MFVHSRTPPNPSPAFLKFGGAYLDHDVLLLKDHSQFFDESFVNDPKTAFYLDSFSAGNPVFVLESPITLSNGFILCPNTGRCTGQSSIILKLWLKNYAKTYKNMKQSWSNSSTKTIFKLSQKFPENITIFNNIFIRPNWVENLEKLTGKNAHFDWSDNFNVHLGLRGSEIKLEGVEDFMYLENSLGDILRYVVCGN